MKKYEIHEAANQFPLMGEKRFKELVEDIKNNGLLLPILIFEGKIIDGRNRYKACEIAEVTPVFKVVDDLDPYAFVWSINGERRDLTADQRYLIWKRCSEKSDEFQEKLKEILREHSKKLFGNTNWDKRQSSTNSATLSKKKGHEKGQAAKAKASKTNRGAVIRGDTLESKRPDLASQVIDGDLSMQKAQSIMKRDQLKEFNPDIPSGRYGVIYADPPWKYGDTRDGGDKDYGGAGVKYTTMTISEISNMQLPEIRENAVLFLWTTSPMLQEAFKVIKSWGFTYKSSFVWDKVNPFVGWYSHVQHEFLLVATRGSATPNKLFKSIIREKKTIHSKKPDIVRNMIEEMYPNVNKIELFARTRHNGWAAYGNEL